MQNLLIVALGGAAGASARYGVGLLAARTFGVAFPWGTLAVNVMGCFLMGLAGQWLLNAETATATPAEAGPGMTPVLLRHLVAIGFLGGLTTFSAFGWDTQQQIASGRLGTAAANVFGNLLLSLGAVFAGAILARSLA
jgi:fluoride exporter